MFAHPCITICYVLLLFLQQVKADIFVKIYIITSTGGLPDSPVIHANIFHTPWIFTDEGSLIILTHSPFKSGSLLKMCYVHYVGAFLRLLIKHEKSGIFLNTSKLCLLPSVWQILNAMWFPSELLMKNKVVYLGGCPFYHWLSSIDSFLSPTALLSSGSKNRKFVSSVTFYKRISFILPWMLFQLIFTITGFFISDIKISPIFQVIARVKTNT